jgi:dimethylhistidine N-methyltransferase
VTSAAATPRLREAAPGRDAFFADLVAGLRRPQKEIPCKYFYDAAGSALFEEICGLEEYYPTRTEIGILRARLPDIARRLGPRCFVIEYGSGSGTKTRLLLDQLHDPVAWVPIDISRSALAASAAEISALHPRLEVLPVCADYTERVPLPKSARAPARRVVFFPGSTIGNFSPGQAQAFLARAGRACGPGGAILLGVDLEKDVGVLERAYDDAAGVTARFNLNLLVRANRELGADFDLDAFRHRAFYSEELGRIEMHLESTRPQRVRVDGERFTFARGETIRTECSYKWRPRELERLASGAGLALRALWTDAKGWFAVLLLEPTRWSDAAQASIVTPRQNAT